MSQTQMHTAMHAWIYVCMHTYTHIHTLYIQTAIPVCLQAYIRDLEFLYF